MTRIDVVEHIYSSVDIDEDALMDFLTFNNVDTSNEDAVEEAVYDFIDQMMANGEVRVDGSDYEVCERRPIYKLVDSIVKQ